MKLKENPVFPDPTNWGCTDALKLHHGPPCTFHTSVGRPPPPSPPHFRSCPTASTWWIWRHGPRSRLHLRPLPLYLLLAPSQHLKSRRRQLPVVHIVTPHPGWCPDAGASIPSPLLSNNHLSQVLCHFSPTLAIRPRLLGRPLYCLLRAHPSFEIQAASNRVNQTSRLPIARAPSWS